LELNHTKIIDDPKLQDGMQNQWDPKLVSKYVEISVNKHNIEEIITFDEHGVSSHPNHISVYRGVKELITTHKQLKAYKLQTTNMIRKYIGLGDLFISKLIQQENQRFYFTITCIPSYAAMRAHYSQFVWFRRLFVLFSSYSYMNTLAPLT